MRLTLCLVALAALCLVAPAPACDVPAQAFAPAYAAGCGVPAQAPVFVQRAPVVYQAAPRAVFRQRAVFAAPAYSGGAAFLPAGGGVNVNVNSGNVGRQRFFRR